MFIGRQSQLGELEILLDRVRTKDDAKPGKAILIRGRRRVGKSRLVEEFVRRSGVPYLFYAAAGRPPAEELELFAEEVRASSLPHASYFDDVRLSSWDAALRQLATCLPEDGPAVVVFDELPYLIEQDPRFEATLQNAFDRVLSRRRVLLVGIGSDLAVMEMLNDYGRPFHQRATEMVVPPLSPAEVGDMLDLQPADALDAYLVTGGLPLICDEWPAGMGMWGYIEQALRRPTSALLVSAERALAAEFPREAQAADVLSTIGGMGERTFSGIRNRANISATAVTRATDLLKTKRIVAAELPLSTSASKETRYRVTDPYLRFWLTFLAPQMPRIERGGGAQVLERIKDSWESWRGRAIEPVVHEGLERLSLPLGPEGEPGVVGGYWTRTNNPEIDIVIADRSPIAKQVFAAGSIKWRTNKAFADVDLGKLYKHRDQLPGADHTTKLIVVSRAGYAAAAASDVRLVTPGELIGAWELPAPGGAG